MKTLPETFTKQGFDHTMIVRDGDLAIFVRNRVGSQRKHFEVVRIARHNGFTLAGKVFPPAETYPTAEQWGTKGWTCPDAERAVAKLDELLAAGPRGVDVLS